MNTYRKSEEKSEEKLQLLGTTNYTDSMNNRRDGHTVGQSDGRTLISVIRNIRGKISSDMLEQLQKNQLKTLALLTNEQRPMGLFC